MPKQLNKRTDSPIIKLMSFVIVLFVLLYMGYHLLDFINNPVVVINPMMQTSEETMSIDGYFIRDEIVLTRGQGVVNLHVDEGTRVGTGQLLASLYGDMGDLEHNARIYALQSRLDMLRTMRDQADTITDAGALDRLLHSQMAEIAHAVDAGATHELAGQSQELRRLLFLREYTFEDTAAINVMITDAEDELSRLQAMRRANETNITNTLPPAFFSAYVDGFESVLRPADLHNVTVASMRSWPNLRQTVDGERTLGKLVPSFHWYFAAIVPFDAAQRLGNETVRFTQGLWATVNMQAIRIGGYEDGMSVVIFRSRENMEGTIRARRQSADIIFRTHSGLRIPKTALHLNSYGEPGVFTLLAGTAHWNPVEIVFAGEAYYLLYFNRQNPRALRETDEVIIGAGLYDGKRLG